MTENSTNTIRTSVADVIYHPLSRVIEIHIDVDAQIDVREIKELIYAQVKLSRNEKYVSLVCFKGSFISPSKEAREYGASHFDDNLTAMAIVVPSLPLMMIIKSYIFFNKPVISTNMFMDKKKALDWLDGKRKE